ncbi:heme peroxidase [Lophiotrema nucula]|uniref:Peroxidase n=1 Tax=Lophiotrema nucula TaxID=690887 RepID=A0A6A5Z042_9PLEO|nr:heme peroxidase [Lophiotrema nucula]
MKLSGLVLSLSLMSLLESTAAYPGMKNTIQEIQRRDVELRERRFLAREQEKRQAEAPDDPEAPEAPEAPEGGDNDDGSTAPVLIGDLMDGGTTPVGKTIARILMKTEQGQSLEAGYKPPLLGTQACKKDTCCVWQYISAAMTLAFRGPSGRCNKYARQAIRLGFHDAGTWSVPNKNAGKDFGGADGSIALSKTEINRAENNGLQDIIGKARVWQKTFGVGMADLIQFAAIHAVVSCPLGPRIRVFVGRKDSSKEAPDGLLPGVNDSADKLIQLFEDKTIPPHDLTALLGAHTTSEQFFVDPKRKGAPQDGTPGVWDTLFYNQTLGTGPLPKQVFRFPSDIAIANDPRARSEWESFSGPGGQSHWNEDYAWAYTRLSMLGVNNMNNMTECTKVLPMPQTTFKGAGELLKSE